MKASRTAALALIAATFGVSSAHASGFEKAIMWGGRTAGQAGIGTPDTTGSESLYFNPAGLVGDKVGQDVSLNVSAINSQFKGPINNVNTVSESTTATTTPFGLIYGATLNENWGFGVGGFVSGGSGAKYEGVDFSGTAGYAGNGYQPEMKTEIAITELSAGVGYKVDDKLKLGLAWRMVSANAELSTIVRSSATSHLNVKLKELKNTQAMAFRAGAQYKLDESTSLGLTFRSEVNFEADGKLGGQVFNTASGAGAANPAITEVDATAYTTLPMAVTLGAKHKLSDTWNLLGEYVWTQYSRVGEIRITSNSTGGFASLANTRLTTNWQDQHNVRLGAEMAGDWPLRFGYVFTSAVSDANYARANLAPPAIAHTLTVGTGNTVKMGENDFKYDFAFDYTTSSGDSTDGTASGGAFSARADTRSGTFSVVAYALHFGASYWF